MTTVATRPLDAARARDIARAFLPESRLGNRYHYFYTRAKLGSDPLYPGVADALRGSTAPLLDLGCGLGLLAHTLRADGIDLPYRGVDVDACKIADATRVAARAGLRDVVFETVDLTRATPSHAGSVAILDVLQYVDPGAQAAILDAAIAMLAPDGLLVIRTGLDDGGRRLRFTHFADRVGRLVGWMYSAPRRYPREDELRARLAAAGLEVEFMPLYGNTPFNNWRIVARRPRGTVAPQASGSTQR
ncbi:MAG TPA: methyltransferase domain-containing protein [Lysobacter sp.]|nr:methyltransferase domain-containing protein [Lysobacter sp.]